MTIATLNTMNIDTATAECPAGFSAGGIACGIKKSGGPDLAIILATRPVSAAAMFTRNLVRAAPIVISEAHLAKSRGKIRAILINSGCANAATGEEGSTRARRTVDELVQHLRCEPHEVLINSTGVIGVQLPDQKIVDAFGVLLKQASPTDGLSRAMRAIMTTDTRPKMAQVRVEHDGRVMHVAGIAKGSGMIHPNMATMIAVLLTDADIIPPSLDKTLRKAVDKSFHRISVDGDTSTNDSVFAMASGMAGEFPNELVEQTFTIVARELALMIVKDGEGAKKLIHVRVNHAKSQEDALQVAQTVAGSMLVRTAVAGGDPNWGRIVAAIGRSGVALDVNRLAVEANGVPLFAQGAPAGGMLSIKEKVFQSETIIINIDLGEGSYGDEFFTCDLTEEYVRINAHYMT